MVQFSLKDTLIAGGLLFGIGGFVKLLKKDKNEDDWSGDPNGKLAKALAQVRKDAKKPNIPLKIEKLDAESFEPESDLFCPCEISRPRHAGVHPTVCQSCNLIIEAEGFEADGDWDDEGIDPKIVGYCYDCNTVKPNYGNCKCVDDSMAADEAVESEPIEYSQYRRRINYLEMIYNAFYESDSSIYQVVNGHGSGAISYGEGFIQPSQAIFFDLRNGSSQLDGQRLAFRYGGDRGSKTKLKTNVKNALQRASGTKLSNSGRLHHGGLIGAEYEYNGKIFFVKYNMRGRGRSRTTTLSVASQDSIPEWRRGDYPYRRAYEHENDYKFQGEAETFESHQYAWDEVCQECGDVPCQCANCSNCDRKVMISQLTDDICPICSSESFESESDCSCEFSIPRHSGVHPMVCQSCNLIIEAEGFEADDPHDYLRHSPARTMAMELRIVNEAVANKSYRNGGLMCGVCGSLKIMPQSNDESPTTFYCGGCVGPTNKVIGTNISGLTSSEASEKIGKMRRKIMLGAETLCSCGCKGKIEDHDDRGYGCWECPQCGDDSDTDWGEDCSSCVDVLDMGAESIAFESFTDRWNVGVTKEIRGVQVTKLTDSEGSSYSQESYTLEYKGQTARIIPDELSGFSRKRPNFYVIEHILTQYADYDGLSANDPMMCLMLWKNKVNAGKSLSAESFSSEIVEVDMTCPKCNIEYIFEQNEGREGYRLFCKNCDYSEWLEWNSESFSSESNSFSAESFLADEKSYKSYWLVAKKTSKTFSTSQVGELRVYENGERTIVMDSNLIIPFYDKDLAFAYINKHFMVYPKRVDSSQELIMMAEDDHDDHDHEDIDELIEKINRVTDFAITFIHDGGFGGEPKGIIVDEELGLRTEIVNYVEGSIDLRLVRDINTNELLSVRFALTGDPDATPILYLPLPEQLTTVPTEERATKEA